jgi:hydrogenase maturation protease
VSDQGGSVRFLVIGYGNPGRLDDGLGPALADLLEPLTSETTTIDSDYQLQVEYAEQVSRHDIVVFADAAVSGPEPFYVEEVNPVSGISFSSHSLGPSEVLGLAHDLFKADTRGFVVGIRGYEFDEFGERLSERALANLAAARHFLESVLKSGNAQGLEQGAEQSVLRDSPAA